MKQTILTLFLLTAILLSVGMVSAATLAEWSLTTDGTASNVNTNVIAGDFTGGLGIKTSSSATEGSIDFDTDGADSKYWTVSTSPEVTDYFQITLSPKEGYDLTISTINFNIQRTGTGPENYRIQSSLNSAFTSPKTIKSDTLPDTSEKEESISTTIQVNDRETAYIRLFGYNAGNEGTGVLRIIADTLNIEGTVAEVVTEIIPPEIEACTLMGNPNSNLKIKDIDITNNGMSDTSFGDDNEWYPLDEIEVDIEVENKGEEKIEDIEIEWGLYDKKNGEWVLELEDEKDFDLKKDKEEIVTIKFKLEEDLDVDLDELDGGDRYVFYVKAVGFDNDVEIEAEVCTSDSENIDIVIEGDFVVLDNIQYPEEVPCGATVKITADVWNIGDNEQEDVSVRIYNQELGLNGRVDIRDVSEFNDEKFEYSFKVPTDIEDGKTYYIELSVLDENDDIFENDNDDESTFSILVKVLEGTCQAEAKGVLITAGLNAATPNAVAGKQVIIDATFKNTGNEKTTYTISLSGNSEWSSLGAIDPATLTLEPGESKTAKIYLDINADATGEKEFKIIANYEDETEEKTVSLVISEGLSGGEVLNHIRDNWFIYAIVIINLILIIAIIVAIRRIVARPIV